MGAITLHVAQTVNTEQLQHGLFQVYNCTTPHKGENKNDNDNNNNNAQTSARFSCISNIVEYLSKKWGLYIDNIMLSVK